MTVRVSLPPSQRLLSTVDDGFSVGEVCSLFDSAESSAVVSMAQGFAGERAMRAHEGAPRAKGALAEPLYAEEHRPAKVAVESTPAPSDVSTTRHASARDLAGLAAAGIAHDLNNFLQIIGNSLELIERRSPHDGAVIRLVGVAKKARLHASGLARQLLAAPDALHPGAEMQSLDALVPTLKALIRRALPAAIAMRTRIASDRWACDVDGDRLESAILNLAINARDAMPDGGTLTLTIENHPAALANLHGSPPGDFVSIGIEDTGTGMGPAQARRAFEPFFTTKGPGKGTGLGLSQVHIFATSCHGFVTLDTQLGRGTRVVLHLPRHVESVERNLDAATDVL